jgi:hypothetical protein
MGKPLLVVSIDAEEEGLWSDSYRADGNTCRNIAHLPRLHAIFARLRVKPTYLVDYPVATDATACAILRELSAGGACEIGAHLHPWCTPPLERDGARVPVTYAHQLPPEMQAAKLERLCSAIADSLAVRPTSYRAGRWGFAASTVGVLERLGFVVDSSVKPLWWDPSRGGPSFIRAPQSAYRLDRGDVCRPGDSSLIEVPATVGFVGEHGSAWEQVTRLLWPAPGLRRWLEWLGRRALLPEVYPLEDMCALTDRLIARGVSVLNLTLHSSATLAGATPFARDEREVERLCARVEGLLEHALGRHGALPVRLSDVPARLREPEPRPAARPLVAAAAFG